MPAELKRVLPTLALLVGLAAVAALVAVSIERSARPQIIENRRNAVLARLHELVPAARHDNALLEDAIRVRDPDLLGTEGPVTVFRARMNGEPEAVLLSPITARGYGGPIRLLVAIRADGSLAGVRVTEHAETDGLGDDIDVSKSDWILQFEGLSLEQPALEEWAIARDGGSFDQFTGASISPRAVVQGVRDALLYFRRNQAQLFEQSAEPIELPEFAPK